MPQTDEKIWWNCSHSDFTRVWDPLTCSLSKGALKQCFLESCLTKSLTFCNFRNKVSMTIIFCWKCLKFDLVSRNGIKKWEKVFDFKGNFIWIWDHKFSESRTGYFHWQPMCYETPLRFNTSVRVIFSKSGSLGMMKKYDESAPMQILKEFGTL